MSRVEESESDNGKNPYFEKKEIQQNYCIALLYSLYFDRRMHFFYVWKRKREERQEGKYLFFLLEIQVETTIASTLYWNLSTGETSYFLF